jgi:hypothetical protein
MKKATANESVYFPKDTDLTLTGYVDADWARDSRMEINHKHAFQDRRLLNPVE